jgi:hypothetical protein
MNFTIVIPYWDAPLPLRYTYLWDDIKMVTFLRFQNPTLEIEKLLNVNFFLKKNLFHNISTRIISSPTFTMNIEMLKNIFLKICNSYFVHLSNSSI